MKIYLDNFGIDKEPEELGLKPILETNKKLDFNSLLRINGSIYRIIRARLKNPDNQKDGYSWIAIEELPKYKENEKDIYENYGEDYIMCPVCGYEDRDSFETHEDTNEYECPNCGSILRVNINYSITYDTQVRKINKNIINLGR